MAHLGHGPDLGIFRHKNLDIPFFFFKALRAGLTNPRDISDSFTVTPLGWLADAQRKEYVLELD